MAEITFRDFAGKLMQGDRPGATALLEQLLGLATPDATKATDHFAEQMKDPAFMMKAMGLRTAVTSGSDDEIGAILGECFGDNLPPSCTGLPMTPGVSSVWCSIPTCGCELVGFTASSSPRPYFTRTTTMMAIDTPAASICQVRALTEEGYHRACARESWCSR